MVTKKEYEELQAQLEEIKKAEIQQKVKFTELNIKKDNIQRALTDSNLINKELKLQIKELEQGAMMYNSLINKKVTVFYKQYVMAGEKFEKYQRAKKIIQENFSFLSEEQQQDMIDKAINYRACTGIVEQVEQGAMKIRTGHGDKTYRYIINLKDIKNCKEYYDNGNTGDLE